MSLSTAQPPGQAARIRPSEGMTGSDYALYATTIFVWGTSWYAIKLQLGVVTPEVSLVWRFGLATLIMMVWAVVAKARFRFDAELHAKFAALGVTIFSTNFALFYYAGFHVPSGLLAVIFSLSSIVNMMLSALFFGERLEWRLLAGALCGVAGVVCMFLPEVLGTSLNASALFALALGSFAVLSFCSGNMISRTLQKSEVPLLPANMWGMIYGTVWMAIIAVLSGDAFIIETSATYVGSLLWLAIMSTVIAFASYLTLMRRIGPGRAGYATVMFPIVALAISTMFEGYQWTFPAAFGAVLALSGNVLILTRPRS